MNVTPQPRKAAGLPGLGERTIDEDAGEAFQATSAAEIDERRLVARRVVGLIGAVAGDLHDGPQDTSSSG